MRPAKQVYQHVYRDPKTGAWKKVRTWSIRYTVRGRHCVESTGSTNPSDAIRLLAQRQREFGLKPLRPHEAVKTPVPGTRRRAPPYQHVLDGRRSRRYAKHGLTTLQKAVKTLGARAIDPTSPVGRALVAWQRDLVADLGGAETVTTAQRQVVEVAARTKLLLDSVDAWLVRQPTLVHHKSRSLLPVVVQRMRLADGLTRYLDLLGLERRAPKVVSLGEYLAQYQPPAADPPSESDSDGDA
jgi:hypothetical protein